MARAARDDPVTTYARAVTEGQVLTNRLVRLACVRHLEDLANGAARDLSFDPHAAQHAIDFFGFLRHSKGEWAGQTFALACWQAFVVGCLFGWQRADGLRRFRTAYCAVARKNGKSTLSAGIALYLLSVKEDDLARKAEKAIALPGAQNAFRRMHLNEWTEQAERWIDLAAWDACAGPVNPEQLRGKTCFGGLDLSTTTDVSALAWVFPPEEDDGLWHLVSRYFVPEENLRKRAERDRVPYDLWTRQGFIEATPGNVVDYGAIEQRILADAALFQVREIAYDPWNATHIALRLQDEGATMVEFRQGFRSMAAPTRELEKLIVSRKIAHGGNPVTRWMAANVAVAQDPAGNLKPAKDKSTERIDGIVALIMAIGRALVAQEEPQPEYSLHFV